jgi:hypothetical protein
VNTEGTPFAEALAGRRNAIVEKWLERLLETYPESRTKFLSREKDRFQNPVGFTLRENLPAVFDGLLKPIPVESLSSVLDGIVRIHAVQDFTAAQATAFPFFLKQVLRSEFAADRARYSDELAALEARIDELALLAFDLFMKCREQIYEARVNEIKRRSFFLKRK